MNAEFFALAFTAALNPKLLALDLLLIENRRPRAMFASILAGGMSLAIAIGLIDVLVVRASAINSQKSVGAGVDLAIGVILLAAGLLILAGVLPMHRKGRQSGSGAKGDAAAKNEADNWARRALREPRLGLAVAIGALVGLPGASYLAALHHLVTGKYSTAAQVIAVFVFVIIEFLLIIIPWLFLELRPEGTAAFLRRSQAWLTGHAKQLVMWICLVLGGYLLISALVRLL
ncbi:MAG TPA: GAP family protein [Streptosporangiaceae bacterium]|nr:GAP family protein [Streptosporangiaceae bacterium]